jgi:hypothetical protein
MINSFINEVASVDGKERKGREGGSADKGLFIAVQSRILASQDAEIQRRYAQL